MERLIAWAGGAVFAFAIAYCAVFYFVDLGRPRAPHPDPMRAAAANVGLVLLFALHHSVMARSWAKAVVVRVVPVRLERSAFVWVSSALLAVVCFLWTPIGGMVFDHRGRAAAPHAVVQGVGIGLIAGALRRLDPLELAGIRQISSGPRPAQAIQARGPYRFVRHPVYLGWLLLTFGTARMTGDRALFAALTGLYVVAGLLLEERSLVAEHGERYRRYRDCVPWRLIPFVW